MTSEKSTDGRPNFSGAQSESRAVPPFSSRASMTSDKSTDGRPNFSGAQSESRSKLISPREDCTDDRPSFNSDSILRSVIEKHKASLKRKFENISEGTITSGAKTLLSKVYTKLYITEGESEGVNKEHEVWQVESASRAQSTEDTPIDCNDIFKPVPGQEKLIRTVMTKGVAGIGKTVSVQKFILDWIDGVANKDVDFMFPLPFRELNLIRNDQYSLHRLLLDFHPELKELKDAEEYKSCQVVFIFDGLDESRLPLNFEANAKPILVTQTSSVDLLMTGLLKGSLLPSARIWITSRPAAASQIPTQYINQVTEVRGFNDPQKEEYFRKRISDEHQAKSIISHIKASRGLYIMCHIPVFCWIAATVLQQMLTMKKTSDIPKTLTEMFIQFLLIQTVRKDQKFQQIHETDTKQLLKSQKEKILKLAELAFKNLQDGNLMFYEEDLRKCDIDVTEASVYSGMCTEIFKEECVFHQNKVYSFVHLSIQEFMAAMFVFHSFVTKNFYPLKCILGEKRDPRSYHQSVQNLKPQDLHVLLSKTVDGALKSRNGHLDLFLRFLTGISLESNQKLQQGLLTQTYSTSSSIKKTCQYIKNLNREDLSPERCINLFHCLLEMNDHSMQKEIQKYLKSNNGTKQNLSPAHCSAMAHMLLMSEEELDKFDLEAYSTSHEGRRRLIPAMRCFKKARLAGFPLSATTCEMLASVLKSPNSLMELDLRDCDLGDHGVQILCTGLSSSHCKLQTLRLPGCLVSDRGCNDLVIALTSNTSQIKELDLSYNHPGESGLILLSTQVETLKAEYCSRIRLKEGVQKYISYLTLDPNTAHKKVSISECKRKAAFVEVEQPYPKHPERFRFASQVLCGEAVSGQCYWEAEWSGFGAHIAVAYKSIQRKSVRTANNMGKDSKSWTLACCSDSYSTWHNNKSTKITVLRRPSRRVGVYLNWQAGILSFYSVSPDSFTLLHTFYTTFTEPLYPGFKLMSRGSSVSLV
ncbi:NACHT, LRR and PYD domains-containing protein 3-like [Sardina pilchardus]|uniref:NACHT, LRR and PYD domains-containing protein 3-like n=1 Tax=Sardina pilchardus TaxID=27697 RepID=UPI002E15D228